MKTLISMKCLILWTPQCLGTYCGNVWNIMSIEKHLLCTNYFGVTQRTFPITWVWQLLSLTIFLVKEVQVFSIQVSAEWMCQWPWRHPQWSFCCCASEHMILSSKKKCSITLVPDCTLLIYPPYSKSLHVKKTNLWGWQFLILNLLFIGMTLSYSEESR